MAGEYKYKQKIIRMKLTTYWNIRRTFPPLKNEGMASYFERLALAISGAWLGE